MITIKEIIDKGEEYEIEYFEQGSKVNLTVPTKSIIDFIVSGELNKSSYIDNSGDVYDYFIPVSTHLTINQEEVIKQYLAYNL